MSGARPTRGEMLAEILRGIPRAIVRKEMPSLSDLTDDELFTVYCTHKAAVNSGTTGAERRKAMDEAQIRLQAVDDGGVVGLEELVGGFPLHSRVMLKGLGASPDLNGKVGTIAGFAADVGRYVVHLDGEAKKVLRVKPLNLVKELG